MQPSLNLRERNGNYFSYFSSETYKKMVSLKDELENMHNYMLPGRVAQSSMCLATDASLDCRSRGREFDPGPVPYFLGV